MKYRGAGVHFSIPLLLFVLFNALMTDGQNVFIKGLAKGAEGKTIIVKSYSDYFTLSEQFTAKSVVDSSGFFEIKCSVPSTTLAVIHIDYYSGEMFLEQNKSYSIEIKNLVFNDRFDKVNYNLSPFNCYIKVISDEKEELNNLTQKLNVMHNTFIKDNIYLLNTRNILIKVDTFLMCVTDTFANTRHVFFNDYLNYRIASLKLLTNYSDPYKLFIDYLYQKPILYENIEYMSFLNSYFENYFQNLTNPVLISDLYVPVNKNQSFPELIDVLGKDSLFINEKLREIIMLSTLNTLNSSNYFGKKNIISILKQVSVSSKFEKHRQMANSMYIFLTRFEKGMPAPDFSLKSVDNSTISLSDFRGKFVYLNFYASWCLNCRDEMELMRKFRQNFDNDVVFISISADREFMNTYHFVHDHNYNWLFLHFNSDYDLLESYGVFAYPDFVLIDKNGNFIQCPAPKPSENIELFLSNLIKTDKDIPGEKK
ncbi:MAG TPA: TlpA disulfide reductase family protein [Bacteroidales bacterium]|nr:TlpA disulfide reductase family protein [Bacteroidales bacterium]